MRVKTFVFFLLFSLGAVNTDAAMLHGVNIAGAEFAPEKLPGVYNKDYIYPSAAIITAYTKFGMNVIRVPFLWERLQPKRGGPMNPEELKRMDEVVSIAGQQHLSVILDMHDYGAYHGHYIGEEQVPEADFTHIWQLIAQHYRTSPNVIFGIMNEPNKQDATIWAKTAKAALLAIRAIGATQLILVPGTLYTGAHSWDAKAGKRSNAETFAKFRDPANNMAIEFHHYFDYNYSGTHNECTAPEVTEAALGNVTAWLKKTHHKGFLAEFGASTQPACLLALKAALEHMKNYPKLWKGWTYWGASEWFGTYPYTIYPIQPKTYPQLTILRDYIH